MDATELRNRICAELDDCECEDLALMLRLIWLYFNADLICVCSKGEKH